MKKRKLKYGITRSQYQSLRSYVRSGRFISPSEKAKMTIYLKLGGKP